MIAKNTNHINVLSKQEINREKKDQDNLHVFTARKVVMELYQELMKHITEPQQRHRIYHIIKRHGQHIGLSMPMHSGPDSPEETERECAVCGETYPIKLFLKTNGHQRRSKKCIYCLKTKATTQLED